MTHMYEVKYQAVLVHSNWKQQKAGEWSGEWPGDEVTEE